MSAGGDSLFFFFLFFFFYSFFFFFSLFNFFFRIVSTLQHRGRKDGLVDNGRGTVDSSELAPVPLCCRHPVQPWASHHLPVPFLLPSKMGLKPCLVVSGKDTWLGASSSQSLEGSCREGRGKSTRIQIASLQMLELPCALRGKQSWGVELFLSTPHPDVQPAPGVLASRGDATWLCFW